MNHTLLDSLQRLQTESPFASLAEPFLILAFFLSVVGFMVNVLAEKDDPLRAFVRCAVAAIFIAALPMWSGWVRDGLYYLPYITLDYQSSLAEIARKVGQAVDAAMQHPAFDFSLFDALGSVLMDFIVVLLMRAVAALGSFIAIPLLFVQIGVEKFLITAMPIAIAALAVPALRNAAQGFVAFWVSVLLWPLFFAVITTIAGFVFSVSNGLGTTWAESTMTGGLLANFLAPFAAAAILIGGILSTPPLAYSICAHGGAALTGPSPSLITFLR